MAPIQTIQILIQMTVMTVRNTNAYYALVRPFWVGFVLGSSLLLFMRSLSGYYKYFSCMVSPRATGLHPNQPLPLQTIPSVQQYTVIRTVTVQPIPYYSPYYTYFDVPQSSLLESVRSEFHELLRELRRIYLDYYCSCFSIH